MKTLVTLCLSVACAVLSSATAYAGSTPFPTWDQKLAASQRFKVLSAFNDEAVLDRETGLVWQRQSRSTDFGWGFIAVRCSFDEVGGRLGWRTPTVEELASLVDPEQDPPGLPLGHPFVLDPFPFLSTSTSLLNPDRAFAVSLDGRTEFGQIVFTVDKAETQIQTFGFLCVRCGQGVDGH